MQSVKPLRGTVWMQVAVKEMLRGYRHRQRLVAVISRRQPDVIDHIIDQVAAVRGGIRVSRSREMDVQMIEGGRIVEVNQQL